MIFGIIIFCMIVLSNNELIRICNLKTFKPDILISIKDEKYFSNFSEFVQDKEKNKFIFLAFSSNYILYLLSLQKKNYVIIGQIKLKKNNFLWIIK